MAGVRLCDTNRSTPITQELVSMDVTISTWTARVVRQVKRKPHIFSVVKAAVREGMRLASEFLLR